MSDDHIQNVRPMLSLRTPYHLIPKWWLDHVEPKISRVNGSRCWYWNGMLDGNGEACCKLTNPETGRRQVHQLKRIIAGWWWDLKKHYEILHACGNQNCLNPHHWYVTATNWQQHDRAAILKKRKTAIDRHAQ
jgi:hypothetical protein